MRGRARALTRLSTVGALRARERGRGGRGSTVFTRSLDGPGQAKRVSFNSGLDFVDGEQATGFVMQMLVYMLIL